MCYSGLCVFEMHDGECMAGRYVTDFADKNNMTVCALAFYLECHPAPDDPIRIGFKEVQAKHRADEMRFWKEYDK